jgi:hypothetical protein
MHIVTRREGDRPGSIILMAGAAGCHRGAQRSLLPHAASPDQSRAPLEGMLMIEVSVLPRVIRGRLASALATRVLPVVRVLTSPALRTQNCG